MLNNVISTNEGASASPASLPGKEPPIQVWLVDDNRPLRSTLMEVFAKCEGVQCTAAFHSPNAVLSALASKAGPDVILLDVHLGKANGLDAIRPIKALSRSTQVLMLTTFYDSKSKERALTAGASGFLLKHFPFEQILDSIHHASRNPVPHLRRLPAQILDSASARKSREAVEPVAAKPSGRPRLRRLPLFRQCLNLMHLDQN